MTGIAISGDGILLIGLAGGLIIGLLLALVARGGK